ncbi:unnamed protein product [Parnassius apollo]|uniref:(apollo) hypothetical protein n=1 Tax=Parnassius apollo TaxID=110799 RepID=A0A8S3X1R0_PARAO|nr:unnamed protein product [Parnassius apollo]
MEKEQEEKRVKKTRKENQPKRDEKTKIEKQKKRGLRNNKIKKNHESDSNSSCSYQLDDSSDEDANTFWETLLTTELSDDIDINETCKQVSEIAST